MAAHKLSWPRNEIYRRCTALGQVRNTGAGWRWTYSMLNHSKLTFCCFCSSFSCWCIGGAKMPVPTWSMCNKSSVTQPRCCHRDSASRRESTSLYNNATRDKHCTLCHCNSLHSSLVHSTLVLLLANTNTNISPTDLVASSFVRMWLLSTICPVMQLLMRLIVWSSVRDWARTRWEGMTPRHANWGLIIITNLSFLNWTHYLAFLCRLIGAQQYHWLCNCLSVCLSASLLLTHWLDWWNSQLTKCWSPLHCWMRWQQSRVAELPCWVDGWMDNAACVAMMMVEGDNSAKLRRAVRPFFGCPSEV